MRAERSMSGNRQKWNKLICLLLAGALIIPLSMFSYAKDIEDGSLLRASTLDEYIEATDPAETDTAENFEIFSTCRIKVKEELDSLEGAEEGVSYLGSTLLRYGSATEAEAAYARLCDKYGKENVVVDLPLLVADSASEPVGWGSDFMNIGEEIKRQAKKHGQTAGKVTIAVIDSGIDSSHEIFDGRTISKYSKDFIGSTVGIADEEGHGTSVAGIISESAPDNMELMILKTYTDGNSISLETVSQAVRYAADNGADVINLSMSSSVSSDMATHSELVRNSIADMDEQLQYATEKGVIICSSAGNNGGSMDELNSYPAVSEYTLAVGSVDKDGARSEFSNYGSRLDFCAPGDNLIVAAFNSDSKYYALDPEHCSGTSFATPYIAVCCAFVKMDDADAGNREALQNLKSLCIDYGDEGWDRYYGWGMPKYEDYTDAPDPQPAINPESAETKAKKIKTITINSSTVCAKVIDKALKKKGGSLKYVTKIVLGSKVKKIKAGAFRKYKKVTILEVRTKRLKKKFVAKALKSSEIRTIKVKVAKKAAVNKKYVKKYKKIFTKKNAGRKVTIKR